MGLTKGISEEAMYLSKALKVLVIFHLIILFWRIQLKSNLGMQSEFDIQYALVEMSDSGGIVCCDTANIVECCISIKNDHLEF